MPTIEGPLGVQAGTQLPNGAAGAGRAGKLATDEYVAPT